MKRLTCPQCKQPLKNIQFHRAKNLAYGICPSCHRKYGGTIGHVIWDYRKKLDFLVECSYPDCGLLLREYEAFKMGDKPYCYDHMIMKLNQSKTAINTKINRVKQNRYLLPCEEPNAAYWKHKKEISSKSKSIHYDARNLNIFLARLRGASYQEIGENYNLHPQTIRATLLKLYWRMYKQLSRANFNRNKILDDICNSIPYLKKADE